MKTIILLILATCTYAAESDLNHDGTINLKDYALAAATYNSNVCDAKIHVICVDWLVTDAWRSHFCFGLYDPILGIWRTT